MGTSDDVFKIKSGFQRSAADCTHVDNRVSMEAKSVLKNMILLATLHKHNYIKGPRKLPHKLDLKVTLSSHPFEVLVKMACEIHSYAISVLSSI